MWRGIPQHSHHNFFLAVLEGFFSRLSHFGSGQSQGWRFVLSKRPFMFFFLSCKSVVIDITASVPSLSSQSAVTWILGFHMVSDNSRDPKQPLVSIISQYQGCPSYPWQYCSQILTWSSTETLIIDQYGLCLGGSMDQVGHSRRYNLTNLPLLISNILLLCMSQFYLAVWQLVEELSLYKLQLLYTTLPSTVGKLPACLSTMAFFHICHIMSPVWRTPLCSSIPPTLQCCWKLQFVTLCTLSP